jgi:hypothetical protein
MTVRDERDRFTWEPGFEPIASGLAAENTLVFVHDLKDDRRLSHRIRGETREELGTVAEDGTGPKQWWIFEWRSSRAPVRVSVYDAGGVKVVSFARPRDNAKRFEIADGSGGALGELVMQKRRPPELVDAHGQTLATWTRKRRPGYVIDYTVCDRAGLEIGRVRNSSADSLAGFRRWLQRFRATREHTLEIVGAVAPELRVMMLAVVAGLYLVFETPPADQSGD